MITMFQILLSIIVVVLCITFYALFAPLLVEIDSKSNVYQFRIVPIFRVWWVMDNLMGHPEMSIFGIHKKFVAQNFNIETTSLETKKKVQLKLNFRRVLAIIQSFKVEKCIVNIDTGDMPLNGKLFPVMYIFSELTGKTFHINFVGKIEVMFTIKNNAYNILKAYFKNK